MAENSSQNRPQNQAGQGSRSGNAQNQGQNRNRNNQNRGRNQKYNRPAQGGQNGPHPASEQDSSAKSAGQPRNVGGQPKNPGGQPKAAAGQGNQNRQPGRGGHKNYNRSKPHNSRFENKKLPAIETVEDIAADISRIEKEIELEIKEIGAMTLG